MAVGLKALDPAGSGLTAAQIVRKLDGACLQSGAIEDMADALAELTDKLTAVAVGRLIANAKGRNLGGVRFVEAGRHQRGNMARWAT